MSETSESIRSAQSHRSFRPVSLRLERYAGAIDISESATLSISLDRIVESDEPVVLDMMSVGFLGTSALSLLAGFARTRHDNGRSTAIAGAAGLRRPLQICGLHMWVTVANAVDDAIVAVTHTVGDNRPTR